MCEQCHLATATFPYVPVGPLSARVEALHYVGGGRVRRGGGGNHNGAFRLQLAYLHRYRTFALAPLVAHYPLLDARAPTLFMVIHALLQHEF